MNIYWLTSYQVIYPRSLHKKRQQYWQTNPTTRSTEKIGAEKKRTPSKVPVHKLNAA